MEKQLLANGEEAAVADARTASPSRDLVKRVKNAISTNIGLYEIRVNLLLWDLFRVGGRERGNLGKDKKVSRRVLVVIIGLVLLSGAGFVVAQGAARGPGGRRGLQDGRPQFGPMGGPMGEWFDNLTKACEQKDPIDILFLDADKEGYVDYLDKLLPLIRPDGLIIAHNMNTRQADPTYVEAITTNAQLDTLLLLREGAGVGVTLKKR